MSSSPYSDHSILFVAENLPKGVKVCNLNVAQPGKLTTYGTCQKVVCSSSLRTVNILSLLHDKKGEIDAVLCNKLSKIMVNEKLTVQEKNDQIKMVADDAHTRLVEIGFENINLPIYWPSRSYNPDANPEDMKRNPDLYIKAPVFVLENDEQFKARMGQAYQAALKKDADIYTFQEVELGSFFYDDVVFKNINGFEYDIDMANFPKVENVTSSCVMTVINNKRMQCVKDNRTESIYAIFKELFNVRDSSKLLVTPVKNNDTNQIRFVVNAHVGYGDANKSSETYMILRKILDKFPEIIFAGDLNLQISKIDWLNYAFGGSDAWKGTLEFLPTPEIVLGNKANPTYDVIFIGNAAHTTKEQLDEFLTRMKDTNQPPKTN